MSLSVLLSQHNDVTVLDVDASRVDLINNNKSTIKDAKIDEFLSRDNLNLTATLDKNLAFRDANFIIVATPTDFDEISSSFDTSSVDGVIQDAIKINNKALVIIKSTIPIGYTKLLNKKHKTDRIIFSPEFLREGHALNDNLYPSRIVIGSRMNDARNFASLLIQGSKKENIEVLYTDSEEAEAIKLFANTYLAMRVAFFNELDSYALENKLNAKSIIEGVCLDTRIGTGYNNPSFGYGGYCLPKDTKQLLATYDGFPQNLIEAIVTSNQTRKDFLAKKILDLNPKTVGIFRLAMKKDSDNFKSSAVLGIMNRIKASGVEVLVYEPELNEKLFLDSKVIKNLDSFKEISDVIILNRNTELLKDVENKCLSRDLFGIN